MKPVVIIIGTKTGDDQITVNGLVATVDDDMVENEENLLSYLHTMQIIPVDQEIAHLAVEVVPIAFLFSALECYGLKMGTPGGDGQDPQLN